MTEYAPQAILDLFAQVKAAFPSAINAGVIGDKAHTYGYHRGRAFVSSSDYSVQYAEDKEGDNQAACGLDISWNKASDQYEVSKRLLAAKTDSRMAACREFYGSTDGVNVCGWDYKGGYAVTSDSSHLWHIHISFLRKYANDTGALARIGDVIAGTSGGKDEDMPQHVSLNRTSAIRLEPGVAVDIKWDQCNEDKGAVFPGGADNPIARLNLDGAFYVSTFTASAKIVPRGSVVHTRLVFCELDGTETGQSPALESASVGQTVTDLVDVRSYKANKGKGIKVRVQSNAGITLESCQWRVLYWRL